MRVWHIAPLTGLVLTLLLPACDPTQESSSSGEEGAKEEGPKGGKDAAPVEPFLQVEGKPARGSDKLITGNLQYTVPGKDRPPYTSLTLDTETGTAEVDLVGPPGAEVELADTKVTLDEDGKAKVQWSLLRVLQGVSPALDPKYPRQRYWRAPVTFKVSVPGGESASYEGRVDVSSWVFKELQKADKGPVTMLWEKGLEPDAIPDGAYAMSKFGRDGFATGNAEKLADIDLIVFDDARAARTKKCGPYVDAKGNKVMKQIKLFDSDLIAYNRWTGEKVATKALKARKSCPSKTTTHEQLGALANGPLYKGGPVDEWIQPLLDEDG